MRRNTIRVLSILLGFGIGLPAYSETVGIPPETVVPTFTAQIPSQDAAVSAQRPPGKPAQAFAGRRVLVKFKPGATVGGAPAAGAAAVSLNSVGINALSRIQGRVAASFPMVGVHLIETPFGADRAIAALKHSDAVEYAEPDYQVRIMVTTPDDLYFSYLWGLRNISAPSAWDIRTDAGNVIVGVIDTGVDYNHPDLSANMWRNPKEIAGNGIDDDGNGWVDDIYGVDFYNSDVDPMDDHSHGTHVSGTIGARGNNGLGVSGVAWSVKIMALKFLAANGWGYDSGAIQAIDYVLRIKAANRYPRVILNNSWGGGEYSRALSDAIAAARDKGVLFVAAAGNDSVNTDNAPMYPASYNLQNIIAVGANDSADNRAWFSNYGCNSVDVFAPGVNIYSTMPGGGYDSKSGTSMAAPHVSGMLALIWAANPNRGWRDVKSALLDSVDQTSSSISRLSVAQGRVDLDQALQRGAIDRPAVWNIAPQPVAGPGMKINLAGHNFGATVGNVHFNGVPLTVLNWANTNIQAKIEPGAPFGPGTLKVTRADGAASRAGACHEVAYKPTLIGQMLQPRGWASGARDSKNTVWIMGGETSAGITGAVEAVALPTGTSTRQDEWTMPTPLSNTAAAIIGSKIYVIGGYNPALGGRGLSDKLQIFDTVAKKWLPGSSLPEPRMQLAVAAVGGKLYAFGGLGEVNQALAATNTTYIYNPATDRWSSGASKMTPTAYATAITRPNSKAVLVAGGFSGAVLGPASGCEQNVVEEYDTAANVWRAAAPLSQARAGAAGGYYRNKPHMLFGFNANTNGEYYDNGAWTQAIAGGPALYTGLGAVGTGGGYMFILGGYDQATRQYSAGVWRIYEP